MIKALLLDLDDTLLGNDLGGFIPAYFNLLVQHIAFDADPQRFATLLGEGLRAMLANTDPTLTLREVFEQRFYSGFELQAEWEPRFDNFYTDQFPQLQTLTIRRPAARAVVDWACANGYQLVLATAPLFPLSAIRQRMRWAGIDDFPYARITHIDNSHFAKPHPEYLAEILAALGLKSEEALMIGNDWLADLGPAAIVGLPHFWVTPDGTRPPESNGVQPVGSGELESFLDWAESSLPNVTVPPAPPRALPYLLSGDLAAALGILNNLPDHAWTRRPQADEWSMMEIICHLRDVEREVHLPRIHAMLESNNPFISSADTDPWAVERDYQSQSGPQALQDFIEARKQTYTLLGQQPEAGWNRPARHAIFGPTSLAEITGWIHGHDLIHLEQLRETRKTVSA